MKEWTPYLEEMMGLEKMPAAERAAHVQPTLSVLEAISTAALSPVARAELLDEISDWDSRVFLFAMPILASLAGDPSPLLRRRSIEMILRRSNAFNEEALRAFTTAVEAKNPTGEMVKELLETVVPLIVSLEFTRDEWPLSSILLYREPLVALSAWLAIERLSQHAGPTSSARAAFERYFADDSSTPVRRRLRTWLTSGPVPIRYHIVVWITRCGISLRPSGRASELLFDRYANDGDAVVSAVSVSGYVQLTPPESVSFAVSRIKDELLELRARKGLWKSPVQPQFPPARIVFYALVRAIGTLVLKRGPHASSALDLFRLLTRPPSRSGTIQMVFRRERAALVANTRVLTAALSLRASAIELHAAIRRVGNEWRGDAGLNNALHITDPDGHLFRPNAPADRQGTQAKTIQYAWVVPIATESMPCEPSEWSFRVVGTAGPHPRLNDSLAPLISAGLPFSPSRSGTDPFSDVPMNLVREAEAGGIWMGTFCDIVGRIASEWSTGDTQSWPDWLLDMVRQFCRIAVVAHAKSKFRAPVGTFSQRTDLRRVARGVLLKQFAPEHLFERVLQCLETEVWTKTVAQLQAELARSALRSLPNAPERIWINQSTLVRIALDQHVPVSARGTAAMVLRYDSPEVTELVRDVLERVTLADEHLLQEASHALAFVPKDTFAALCKRFSNRVSNSNREPRFLARSAALCLEIVARALEEVEHSVLELEALASNALGALERMPQRYQRPEEAVPSIVRRRMLYAFTYTKHKLERNGRALFSEILRLSSASDWLFYRQCTEVKPEAEVMARARKGVQMELVAQREHSRNVHEIGARDRHAFVEAFSRHCFLQADLLRTPHSADVLQGYLDVADTLSAHELNGAVTLIEGERALAKNPEEQVAVLRRAGNPNGVALVDEAAEIETGFVVEAEHGLSVRCLGRYVPTTGPVLNLHELSGGPEMRSAKLRECLTRGPVIIVARIISAKGQRITVDLGANLGDLLPRHVTNLRTHRHLVVDDSVLVRLRTDRVELRCALHRTLPAGGTVLDLTVALHPASELSEKWKQRSSGSRLYVRGDIRAVGLHESRSGVERIRIEVRNHSFEVAPVLLNASCATPPWREREPVWLEIEGLSFVPKGRENIAISVLSEALPGAVMTGTLNSVFHAKNRRRHWTGISGTFELPILRKALSADLGTLLRFDDDAVEIETQLARFRDGSKPVLLKVTDNGQAFSVVDAPARWRKTELLLALKAKLVEALCFVERSADDHNFRFQVIPIHSPLPSGYAHLMPCLGTFVNLDETELFDVDGKPVHVGRWIRGTRIKVEIRDERVSSRETNLPLQEVDSGSPRLIVVSTNNEASEFEGRYANGVSVQVERTPTGAYRLLNDSSFRAPNVQPMDVFPLGFSLATIVSDFDAWSEDYSVTVRPQRERKVRYTPKELPVLIQAADGLLLGRNPTFGAHTVYVNGLPSFFDSEVGLLAPAPLRPEELDFFAQKLRVRIRRTVSQQPVRVEVCPDALTATLSGELQGMVVRDPIDREVPEVTVAWASTSELPARTSLVKAVDLPLGSVVSLHSSGKQLMALARPRRIFSTILADPLSLAAYARFQRKREIKGRLLRIGDEETPWLFCMEPAIPVFVNHAEVSNGVSVRSLDILVLSVSAGPEKPTIEILRNESSPWRQAIGKAVTFDVMQRIAGRLLGNIQGEGDTRLPRFWARMHAPARSGALLQALRSGGNQHVHCVLRDVQLEITDWRTPQARILNPSAEEYLPPIRYSFTVDLVEKEAAPIAIDEPRRLEIDVGERSVEQGRVIRENGRPRVILSNVIHDFLEFPAEEYRWLRAPGDDPPFEYRGPLAIFRPEANRYAASLRRVPPEDFQEWVKNRPIDKVDSGRLGYVGVFSAEDLKKEFDITEESEQAFLLFEEAPGEMFYVPETRTLFMGVPFNRRAMIKGDVVARFRITLQRETDTERQHAVAEIVEKNEGQAPDSENRVPLIPMLEVLVVDLDLVHELEKFHGDKGFHFGRVKWLNDKVVLTEVRGGRASGTEQLPTRPWRYELLTPTKEQLQWLHRVWYDESEEDYVYLRFASVDHTLGVIYFRLATAEEVFRQSHLVYVRPKRLETVGIQWLEVVPLNRHMGRQCRISDNEFSERRGCLDAKKIEWDRIILARVTDDTDPDWTKLSLKTVPARRFPTLIHECPRRGQGIVKEHKEANIHFELREGVSVWVPNRYVVAKAELFGQLRRGAIAFFRTDPARFEITLEDVVPSHIEYLKGDGTETVLVRLWGERGYREKCLERDNRLDCSIIGLPQLRASASVNEATAFSHAPIVQAVLGRETGTFREPIELKRSPAPDTFVGRFQVSPKNDVTLVSDAGKALSLKWADVTFLNAPPAVLASKLRNWRWYNTTLDDRAASIRDAEVIASLDLMRGSYSLTTFANSPLPVDHLVEQFEHPDAPAGPLHLVVAWATEEKVVVEVAPGRYVEISASLLEPLHGEKLREGLKLSWTALASGDVLELNLLRAGKNAVAEVLPRFHILSIKTSVGWALNHTWVAHLQIDGNLATEENAQNGSLPANRFLTGETVRVDLTLLQQVRSRLKALRRLFETYGDALILEGEVTKAVKTDSGVRCEYDIGINVSYQKDGGGKYLAAPRRTVPPRNAPAVGDKVSLRVLEIEWDEHSNVRKLSWEFARRASKPPARGLFLRQKELLVPVQDVRTGDSVRLFCPSRHASEARVDGLEKMSVQWREHKRDSLRLHHPAYRAAAFERIFAHCAELWCTVEWVDYENKMVTLSRATQMDTTLPQRGKAVRGKIVGVLDRENWLLFISGVPHALRTTRFCVNCDGTELLETAWERQHKPIEVEVTIDANGDLSATEVYNAPSGEFDAMVEMVGKSGVMALSRGMRVYVPGNELAMARLTAEHLSYFFPPGTELRLTCVERGHRRVFSQIATRNLQAELRELRRTQGPLHVRVESGFPDDVRPRVAKTPAHNLMEIQHPANAPLPEGVFAAWLAGINLRAHSIILTPVKIPPVAWQVASFGTAAGCEVLLPKAAANRSNALRYVCQGGPDILRQWLSAREHFHPTVHCIRSLLDAAFEAWGDEFKTKLTQAAGGIPGVIPQILGNSIGPSAGEVVDGIAAMSCFVRGYLDLLIGAPATARHELETALKYPGIANAFDAQFARALATLRTTPSEGAKLLIQLRLSLYTNAAATLFMPLPRPIGSGHEEFETKLLEALETGARQTVEEAFSTLDTASPTESELARRARRLWLACARSEFADRDSIADDFLATLRRDSADTSPDFLVAGAKLNAARGDLQGVFRCLDQIPSSFANNAQYWRRWLRGGSAATYGDRQLLECVDAAYRICRWGDPCPETLVSELWQKFRQSPTPWYFSRPFLRPVGESY